jgi:hypothetical protein
MTSPFVGSWSYRSFQNNPDLTDPCTSPAPAAGRLPHQGSRLENLILRQARAKRYSLFDLLGLDDDVGPCGRRDPRRFWKIVAARSGAKLQTFAFIL